MIWIHKPSSFSSWKRRVFEAGWHKARVLLQQTAKQRLSQSVGSERCGLIIAKTTLRKLPTCLISARPFGADGVLKESLPCKWHITNVWPSPSLPFVWRGVCRVLHSARANPRQAARCSHSQMHWGWVWKWNPHLHAFLDGFIFSMFLGMVLNWSKVSGNSFWVPVSLWSKSGKNWALLSGFCTFPQRGHLCKGAQIADSC